MFFKIGVLKNFLNFTGKHLCLSFFLIKLQALRPATSLKTDSDTCVFLWNLWTFFTEQLILQKTSGSICYKIVSPILPQDLINDFAKSKHYSGTLLLVEDVTSSHDFAKENYIFQKGVTFFNRST